MDLNPWREQHTAQSPYWRTALPWVHQNSKQIKFPSWELFSFTPLGSQLLYKAYKSWLRYVYGMKCWELFYKYLKTPLFNSSANSWKRFMPKLPPYSFETGTVSKAKDGWLPRCIMATSSLMKKTRQLNKCQDINYCIGDTQWAWCEESAIALFILD